MDYVKRRLEQARQQVLAEKIEEAARQYKLSRENAHPGKNSNADSDNYRSRLNITSVLIGFAAGVAVTTTASLAYLSAFDNNQARQDVDLLNKKIELLAKNIAGLENKLTNMLALAESSKIRENEQASAGDQNISESESSAALLDARESSVALSAIETPGRVGAFSPTHTVTTKVNLRSSASVDSTSFGVLATGTKIQKIRENGDWYYVNTEEFGTGWCAARYLSP
jgi:hypothetical protein